MKAQMKAWNKRIGMVVALLIGTLVAQATAYAGIGPDPRTSAWNKRIVGVWDVDVSITNCSGTELFRFKAMHKFELGGTGQVVPATSPTGLSAHMMVWNYVSKNDYQMAFKMYRFDPATGAYIGWVEVINEVAIDRSAHEYSGTGFAQFYDTDGNLLPMANCPVFQGTRYSGEP